MSTMRKEYELQTDVLATVVATTRVTPKHADWLTAFATRTDYRGARYVMTRDVYSERPARIRGIPTVRENLARMKSLMAALKSRGSPSVMA